MLLIWLIVWVLSSTPHVDFSPMNNWAIALIICGVIDLFGGRSAIG